jgi:cell wall-associated NlpC family hydrolase
MQPERRKGMLSKKTRMALIKAGVALTISFGSVGAYSFRTYADVVNTNTGTLTVKASSIWTYSAPDWNARTRTYASGTVFEVTEKHSVEGRYMYKLSSGLYITANEAYVTFMPKAQTAPVEQPVPEAPAPVAAETRMTTANLNMRTGPGTTFAIITTIPKDSSIKVESESEGWAKVSYSGKSGYVSTAYLIKSEAAPAPAPVPEPAPQPEPAPEPAPVPAPEISTFERKTTVNLNMRTGPGTSFGIIVTIPKDMSVTAEAESNGWVKVTYSGKTGYVAAQYLTQPIAVVPAPIPEPAPAPEPEPVTDPVAEVPEAPASDDWRSTTANLNLRSGEGTSFPIIKVIPSGTLLNVEAISGTWAKVTYSGSTGYVATAYLVASEAPATGEDIVEYAKKFLGVPYVWAGNTPESGFDCSGFTRYVFANFGISLPRISRDQARTGTAVTQEQRKPGDLLYFGSNGYVDHVGIYAGDNQVIHASSTNKMVVISNLQYYTATYMGARRLLNP